MYIPAFRFDLFSWLSIKKNIFVLHLFSQMAVSAFKDFASVEPDLIWLSLNDLFCAAEFTPPHKTFKPVRLAGVAPQGKEYAENVNILLSTIWKQCRYYRHCGCFFHVLGSLFFTEKKHQSELLHWYAVSLSEVRKAMFIIVLQCCSLLPKVTGLYCSGKSLLKLSFGIFFVPFFQCSQSFSLRAHFHCEIAFPFLKTEFYD